MSYVKGYMLFPSGDPYTTINDLAAREAEEATARQLDLEAAEEKLKNDAATKEAAYQARLAEQAALHEKRLAAQQAEARKGQKHWVSRGGTIPDKALEKELLEELRQEKEWKRLILLWEAYDTNWRNVLLSQNTVSFSDIPWPTMEPVTNINELKAKEVLRFFRNSLFIPGHKATKKDRLRASLVRWHEDKLGRVMARISPRDLDDVKQGVSLVFQTIYNELNDPQNSWDEAL